MSKLSIVPLTFGFSFAIISGALGQGSVNYTANPSNPVSDLSAGGLSLPGAGASATGPASTGKDAADDENNPNLQRLRSKDSLAAGAMSRDEGQLTAKARRREKILQVESTKQLPTSGTDPRFQGSLLNSGLPSIQDTDEKANTNPRTNIVAGADADTGARDESDPRFKAKRLMFTPMTDDQSKKTESPRTKADSSPSPSPSSTASATPSSR